MHKLGGHRTGSASPEKRSYHRTIARTLVEPGGSAADLGGGQSPRERSAGSSRGSCRGLGLGKRLVESEGKGGPACGEAAPDVTISGQAGQPGRRRRESEKEDMRHGCGVYAMGSRTVTLRVIWRERSGVFG